MREVRGWWVLQVYVGRLLVWAGRYGRGGVHRQPSDVRHSMLRESVRGRCEAASKMKRRLTPDVFETLERSVGIIPVIPGHQIKVVDDRSTLISPLVSMPTVIRRGDLMSTHVFVGGRAGPFAHGRPRSRKGTGRSLVASFGCAIDRLMCGGVHRSDRHG